MMLFSWIKTLQQLIILDNESYEVFRLSLSPLRLRKFPRVFKYSIHKDGIHISLALTTATTLTLQKAERKIWIFNAFQNFSSFHLTFIEVLLLLKYFQWKNIFIQPEFRVLLLMLMMMIYNVENKKSISKKFLHENKWKFNWVNFFNLWSPWKKSRENWFTSEALNLQRNLAWAKKGWSDFDYH